MSHLYGGMDEPKVKTIDVFVCKLRRKLTTVGGEKYIETVWGRGYRTYSRRAIAGPSGSFLPACRCPRSSARRGRSFRALPSSRDPSA